MAERNLTAIIHPRAVRGQIKQPAYTASAGLIVRFLIMKIAAVAIISFFENTIKQVVVQVHDNDGWKEAFAEAMRHGLYDGDPDQEAWIMGLPDSIDDARIELCNGGMDLCVTFFET